ncbi:MULTISPECIES: TIGR02328 family protein [Helcococcus]|uniref:TIGR02328 family protein n=1 Tax=Helcococcus bovis TaxID=3153252 RepID=A0ABW9F7K2_9FIRM
MRLWHQDLICKLPRNQLLGQHREYCALRGNGWRIRHKTVDYVFNYSPYHLYSYHTLVMDEMEKRGYRVSIEWINKNYRGKKAPAYRELKEENVGKPIYSEHDKKYMQECIQNLNDKGIFI